MLRTSRARHARPSRVPAQVAAATAVGSFLTPLLSATHAEAADKQASTVRISGPGQTVAPGQAPVSVRLLADGGYVRNGVVEVQIPEGTGWRTVAKAATDSYGLGRTSVNISRDTRVRAYYRGSEVRTTATSASTVIDVEALGQRALQEAARHKGAPYQYGATGPSAFDCSGFTRYVYGRLGKSLPHSSQEQEQVTRAVSQSAAQVGDLIFLGGGGHVGIYAGNGKMWDAPRSGGYVSLRSIWTSDYRVGRVA